MANSWHATALGDVVQAEMPICYGVLKPGDYAPDGVPLVRITDMEGDTVDEDGLFRISRRLDEEFARSRLRGGELLLSIQGTVGRVALASPRLAGANISRTLARICVAGSASPEFLRHWLRSVRGQKALEDAVVGTTRSSLNISEIRKLSVPQPPLLEQRRIADILDTLDDAIRKTEQLVAKLKTVKQGVLHDLLKRGIRENGELRDPEQHPEEFQQSPLGVMPRDWSIERFGRAAESTNLGTSKRGAEKGGDNLLLLKMGNLGWGELRLDDIELVARRRVPDWKRLLLLPGDLLFNTRNTPDLVGKTVAWRGNGREVVPDNNILRVRFGQSFSGAFVAAYMANGAGRTRVGQLATGTTSVAAIYWKSLERLLLPQPPRKEQDRIVECLEAIEVRIAEEARRLEKDRMVKEALMEDLLSGRVRVSASETAA